jgi:hypothetical protein
LFICMIWFIGEEVVRGSDEMHHLENHVVIKQESTREVGRHHKHGGHHHV